MDEFRLFMAPKILGDEQAAPVFAGRVPDTMDQALGLRLTDSRPSGEDILLTFRPQKKEEDDVHGTD